MESAVQFFSTIGTMYQSSSLLIFTTYCLLFISAYSRYNSMDAVIFNYWKEQKFYPWVKSGLPPRSYTSFIRYHASASFYSIIICLFVFILSSAPNAKAILSSAQPSDISIDAGSLLNSAVVAVPFWLTLYYIYKVPATPYLSTADISLRKAVFLLASIPHRVRELAEQLSKSEFDDSILDRTAKSETSMLVERLGSPFSETLIEWRRLAYQLARLRGWSEDRTHRFYAFTQMYREDYDSIKKTFSGLKADVLRYDEYQMQSSDERIVEFIENFPKTFSLKIKEIRVNLYYYISYCVLYDAKFYRDIDDVFVDLGLIERRSTKNWLARTVDYSAYGTVLVLLYFIFSFLYYVAFKDDLKHEIDGVAGILVPTIGKSLFYAIITVFVHVPIAAIVFAVTEERYWARIIPGGISKIAEGVLAFMIGIVYSTIFFAVYVIISLRSSGQPLSDFPFSILWWCLVPATTALFSFLGFNAPRNFPDWVMPLAQSIATMLVTLLAITILLASQDLSETVAGALFKNPFTLVYILLLTAGLGAFLGYLTPAIQRRRLQEPSTALVPC